MSDDGIALEVRISAAKAALPYCAHRLHTVDVSVTEPEMRDVKELTREELMAIAAGREV